MQIKKPIATYDPKSPKTFQAPTLPKANYVNLLLAVLLLSVGVGSYYFLYHNKKKENER